MNRVNKALVAAGLLAIAGGAGVATKFEIDQAAQVRASPVVQNYTNAAGKLIDARREFAETPGADTYTPQHLRFDYSPGQAHSQVEHSWQNMEVARGVVNGLRENAEVQQYVKTGRASIYGVGALVAGMLSCFVGLARRD
jgi:hypothetical protein